MSTFFFIGFVCIIITEFKWNIQISARIYLIGAYVNVDKTFELPADDTWHSALFWENRARKGAIIIC